MAYVRPLWTCEQDYDCPFCGAKRGEHCLRKVDGRRAREPHTTRSNLEFNELVKQGRIRCFGLNIT